MHDAAAKKLIEETFNQPYSHDRFRTFIHEITQSYEDRNTNCQIPDNFKDSIKSVFRIGKFVDSARNEIDILAVTLARETSLDRARTLQRNFIARHLSVRQKEAALVAFVSPESSSWRFSLVRRELSIVLNRRGKSGVKADFSPVRRFSFLVGTGEHTHTVKRQIIKFLTTDDKPTLKTLEEAFNIETVTDEFFKEYRELFNRVNDVVVECLSKNASLKQHFAEKDIEASDFAKRLLGQIVFLYFLQKKGWLGVPRDGKWGDGSRTFLRDLYNKAEKEGSNFFDKYLRHLFYEALNRDHSDNGHYHSLFDSRIPFLNGGLFEPYHDYEWSKHDIALPNTVFHELGSSLFGDDGRGILDVFDRYNFTVAEDEPLEREVAIDPEMLGKVFENLLEVKDRKAKGTYYTPREIVHYMCQESLIAHLTTRFPDIPKADIEDVIRYGDLYLEYDTEILKRQDEDRLTRDYNQCQTPATIRDHAADLDQALATVKVCDPAIGSGAFPVGMMTEIIRARRVLALHMRKTPVAYDLKRQTIQDCLYGVDLDPGAIEIAKLRLWLSLVVDEDNFDQIQALPNLDYKIMQGNSLLQTFEGVKLFDDTLLRRHDNDVRRKQQLEGEMSDLRDRLMAMLTKSSGLSDPKEKKGLERAIGKKQKEIDALNDSGKEAKTAVTLLDGLASASGIADQLRKLHVEFFRTAQAAEKKRLKAEIEHLEMQLVETSLKELHQNNAAPLIEKIRKLQRANVKPYFLWKLHFSEVFSGDNGGFDIVIANPPWGGDLSKSEKASLKVAFPDIDSSTPNSFAYFIGLAFQISHKNIAYILPDSILIKDYAKTRKLLKPTLSQTHWYQNIGVPEKLRPFLNVEHDVCAILSTPDQSSSVVCSTSFYVKKNDGVVVRRWLASKQGMIVDDFDNVFNLALNEQDFAILQKIMKHRAIDGFMQCHEGIHTGNAREILFKDVADNKWCKPLYYGGGAGDLIANFVSERSGWFVDYRKEIVDKNKGLYASLRDENIFLRPKIYISRTGNPFKAFVDDNNYASNNFFSLQYKDYEQNSITALCVILPFIISPVAQYFIRKFAAPRLGNTFVETKIIHLLKFRIPILTKETEQNIRDLVHEVILKKKDGSISECEVLEQRINDVIYKLYDFTNEEIAIIEGSSA